MWSVPCNAAYLVRRLIATRIKCELFRSLKPKKSVTQKHVHTVELMAHMQKCDGILQLSFHYGYIGHPLLIWHFCLNCECDGANRENWSDILGQNFHLSLIWILCCVSYRPPLHNNGRSTCAPCLQWCIILKKRVTLVLKTDYLH